MLLVPDDRGAERNVESMYSFYGVGESFEIKKLPWLRMRGRGYIYALEAAICAKRYVPDLVYGRFLPGCFFSGLFGLAVVYESHFPVGDHGRICEWMFARLVSGDRLKRVVVVSEALAGDYEARYGLKRELMTVAHDAAEEPGRPGDCEIGRGDRLQVGYVGHLYPGRGIEIIEELAKKCCWADFHMVGGTDEDVKRWTERLRDVRNVKIHGFVPPSDTDRYRRACDVLLAPYQRRVAVEGGGNTSEWMSPLKVFEYMAAGKAIACSDLPVLREVLTHERTALLCSPVDPNNWVEALVRLRDEPDLRKRLAATAREEYLSKYTWTARAEKVLEGL